MTPTSTDAPKVLLEGEELDIGIADAEGVALGEAVSEGENDV